MRRTSILFIALAVLVLALNAFAQELGTRVMVTTRDGEELPLYRSSHALVVGVSDYTHGWPDLPGAVEDAGEVAGELDKHGFEVCLLANPTKRELDDALNDFVFRTGVDPDDRLLFYFAGHGCTMEMAYGAQMGYVVPADAPLPALDAVGFRQRSISMQLFEHNARQIESKHVLYLFDSCFSGSIFALGRAVPSAITYKTARPVRQFITAGEEGEEVPDKSVFESQFIEALRGEADLNGDGYVTGTELGEFLQTTVVNYSRESQHPQYGKIRDPKLDKGDYVFVVGGEWERVSWSDERGGEGDSRRIQTWRTPAKDRRLILLDVCYEPEDREAYFSGSVGWRLARELGVSFRYGRSSRDEENHLFGGLLWYLPGGDILNLQAGWDDYTGYSMALSFMYGVGSSFYVFPVFGMGFGVEQVKIGLGFGVGR